jgi:hypothetical protein
MALECIDGLRPCCSETHAQLSSCCRLEIEELCETLQIRIEQRRIAPLS